MRSLLVFFFLLVAVNVTPADSENTSEAASGTPPGSSLADTFWWVEDILGQGVVDNSHTTLGFMDADNVAGDAGCNRYRGSYLQEGESLEFGALAGTMMACPEALMDQEQRFHKAMEQVESWRVEATGLLYLLGPDGEVLIRASATERENL